MGVRVSVFERERENMIVHVLLPVVFLLSIVCSIESDLSHSQLMQMVNCSSIRDDVKKRRRKKGQRERNLVCSF